MPRQEALTHTQVWGLADRSRPPPRLWRRCRRFARMECLEASGFKNNNDEALSQLIVQYMPPPH